MYIQNTQKKRLTIIQLIEIELKIQYKVINILRVAPIKCDQYTPSCSDKISTIIANGLLLTSCVKLKDTFKCGVYRTTINCAVSLLFSSLLNVFKDTCPKNVVYRSVRLQCTKAAPHPTRLNDGR